MNIVYLCIITLFAGLTPSGQAKIDKLLSMASNYQQVEKTIMLLMQPNKVITRIPCISPLQAEDLRHIPVSSAYGQRLHPILNEYKHHSGVDLPGILGERVYATADGTVAEVGENKVIGKFVKLTHAYGFTTVYGHLSQINRVGRQHRPQHRPAPSLWSKEKRQGTESPAVLLSVPTLAENVEL